MWRRMTQLQNLSATPHTASLLRSLTTLAAQLFLIVGGAIPYIPQYFEILHTTNTQGFSLYVCLAIVLSSLLRMSYWFGKFYDWALFVQSMTMVSVMFIMLELCLRMDRKCERVRSEHYFLELQPSYFWKWTDLLSYVQASVFVFIFSTFVVVFFGWLPGVTEGVGYLSLIIEAGLALPQFFNNCKNQSTYGMNKSMVCLWAFGDIFKLTYFIKQSVPAPFLFCASFQFLLDLAILAQIFVYGDRQVK